MKPYIGARRRLGGQSRFEPCPVWVGDRDRSKVVRNSEIFPGWGSADETFRTFAPPMSERPHACRLRPYGRP